MSAFVLSCLIEKWTFNGSASHCIEGPWSMGKSAKLIMFVCLLNVLAYLLILARTMMSIWMRNVFACQSQSRPCSTGKSVPKALRKCWDLADGTGSFRHGCPWFPGGCLISSSSASASISSVCSSSASLSLECFPQLQPICILLHFCFSVYESPIIYFLFRLWFPA